MKHSDVMNGNLDTPRFYFAVASAIIALSVFFTYIAVSILLPADDRLPTDATEIRTTFLTYEQTRRNSGALILHASGYEKPFALYWLSGYEIPLPDAGSLCNGDDYIVTVHEAKSEYVIYAMRSADGHSLVRAYDVNTAHRNTQFGWCVALLVFSVLAAGCEAMAIAVGRNPERYPRWLCRLLYKDEAWLNRDVLNRDVDPARRSKGYKSE